MTSLLISSPICRKIGEVKQRELGVGMGERGKRGGKEVPESQNG